MVRAPTDPTYWIDVTYWPEPADPIRHGDRLGTFGPFDTRSSAEAALVQLAGRPDVRQAHLREPGERI